VTIVESRAYDTETIDRALWTIALHAGSANQASEALEAQGISIPRQTLHRWKTQQHPERYEEICKEASARLVERIAAEAEQFMLHASRVELKALERLEAQLDAGEVKDTASALRNITTAKALNNDKIASPLRGRPSIIHEHRNADAILRELAAYGYVDSTATEETPSHEAAELLASS
jgi:hypothetical protein